MLETKIAELMENQARLEAHSKSQEKLLESLGSSTKELHDSVREQQITIINQSNSIENAIQKMTESLDRQTKSDERSSDMNERLLVIEERLKSNDKFWGPIKNVGIKVFFGFLFVGLLWASVKAYIGASVDG